jgi:hypothetical protein
MLLIGAQQSSKIYVCAGPSIPIHEKICKTTPQWAVMNTKQAEATMCAPSLSPSSSRSTRSLHRHPMPICRRATRHLAFLWLLIAQPAVAITDASPARGLHAVGGVQIRRR